MTSAPAYTAYRRSAWFRSRMASGDDLVAAIRRFIDAYNDRGGPFSPGSRTPTTSSRNPSHKHFSDDSLVHLDRLKRPPLPEDAQNALKPDVNRTPIIDFVRHRRALFHSSQWLATPSGIVWPEAMLWKRRMCLVAHGSGPPMVQAIEARTVHRDLLIDVGQRWFRGSANTFSLGRNAAMQMDF